MKACRAASLLTAIIALGCADDRPNLVLYVADTLRADALGAYGNATIDTPHLDALAEQGVLFEHAYAPTSWTRASVATILTGLDPAVHGIVGRHDALSPDIPVLAEWLEERGYATAAVLANPNAGSFYGFARGFDTFHELYGRRVAGTVHSSELSARADEVTRQAEEWLAGASEPFFLFVLSVDPHWPYAPPEGFDRYGGDYDGWVRNGSFHATEGEHDEADRERVRSFYWGEVAYNDLLFGALMDALDRAQMTDRTWVAFTSDHGEEFWEHGGQWHGRRLYEESIRVPLLLRGPGVAPGSRRGAPVGLVNLMPTLLDALGVERPAFLSERRSLLDAETDAEESAPLFASLHLGGYRARSVRRHPWKLIHDLESDTRRLYHLERDPEEMKPERGPEFEELEARLEKDLEAVTDTHRATRLALLGHAPTPRVDEDTLPEDDRRALEALGYLDALPDASDD